MSEDRPTLLVGLDNPGQKYAETRHNIGFMLIDRLAQDWGVKLSEDRKFQGEYGETAVPGLGKIRLLKPTTFMNQSGRSLRAVLDWYKLTPQQILVIYDDMDLPLGRLRLRQSGSAGTHNGMKSIISHLSSKDFPRLRLGISLPRSQSNDRHDATVSHVLGKFAVSEQSLLKQVLDLAQEATETALRSGVETAMNRYNARSLEAPAPVA